MLDLGVLSLKPNLLETDAKSGLPRVTPSHPAVVEWRAMTDRTVDRALIRVSVGIEGWEALRDDLVQGLEAVLREAEEDGKLGGADVGGSQQIMI